MEDAGITLVAVAGNGRYITELAEQRGIEFCSDPKELIREDVDAVLVADPALSLDTEAIATMMQQTSRIGARLFTLTPRPAEFSESSRLLAAGPLPRPLPLMRDFALGRSLFDAATSFGAIDAVEVSLDAAWPCGSCAGRLFDAFDILYELLGTPNSVEAVASRPPNKEAGPELQRVLAIARYNDGRAASISVGDDAGGWSRAVTIWGNSSRVRWIDGVVDYSDGKVSSREARPAEEVDLKAQFAKELAESVCHVLKAPPSVSTNERRIDVLSAVEACMLSVRTGEHESVQRVRSVLDRV